MARINELRQIFDEIKGSWKYRRANELIFVIESGSTKKFLEHPWLWFKEVVSESNGKLKVKIQKTGQPVEPEEEYVVDWKQVIGLEVQLQKKGEAHPKFIFGLDYAEKLFKKHFSLYELRENNKERIDYVKNAQKSTLEGLITQWQERMAGYAKVLGDHKEELKAEAAMNVDTIITDECDLVSGLFDMMYRKGYGESSDAPKGDAEMLRLVEGVRYYMYSHGVLEEMKKVEEAMIWLDSSEEE